jgi:hypothetical protein
VAILSALISFLSRQIGKVLQAVFGWSITALFGRLDSKKQTAVSVALLLSIAWPIFVVGVFFPGIASWLVAFVPMHKLVGRTVLRIVWCTLAVLAPPVVGLITHWVAPAKKTSKARALLHGYPLALGYACAFLITAITVPIVKIASALRGWKDEHVFVQPRDGRYRDALRELAQACAMATGCEPDVRDVPTSMSLATKVLRALARGVIEPIVAENPKVLRLPHVEIYLYPADLLMRGAPAEVAHIRAAMTRTMLERDAYLVGSPEAKKVQDRIDQIWEIAQAHEGHDGGVLDDLRAEIDRLDVPFEDWSMLERIIRHAKSACAVSG